MKSNNNSPDSRVVAVFGGSRFLKDSKEYLLAYNLGFLLAKAGFHIINGGGPGAMEATAMGVKEGGGHTIGAMVRGVEWAMPNSYLDETIECDDVFLRIREMYERSCAFIVMKGGTGTLAELALIWNLLSLETEHVKPLLLVGENWQTTINAINIHMVITDEEKRVIVFCEDPTQVISQIQELPL